MLLAPSSRLRLKLHISVALVISLGLACTAAPLQESTEIQHYSEGCYYNYNYYNEGDRILTNEPCLNCTCHNKMLMCYLRVCPFTKPIGHDCTIEKREDQCCPIITCPEVPVELMDNQESGTHLAMPKNHGCSLNGKYYPEGAQVPSSPSKPCELCYCIHNRTSCIMQECTLHVNGCQPIYHRNVCCPVRYNCDHDAENELVFEDEMTTTVRPTPGFILTTTLAPTESAECVHNGTVYADGESIKSDQACEHCYCMRGDIVCAVQECKLPLDKQSANCTALPAEEGDCCPNTYVCSDSDENEIAEPTDSETIYKPEIKITTELPFTVYEPTTIETQNLSQDIHDGISEEDVQLQEHIDDKSEEEQKLDETDESNLLKGGGDVKTEESKTTPTIIDEATRPAEEHLITPSPETGISLAQTTKTPDEFEVTHFEEITTPAIIASEETTTPRITEKSTASGTIPSERKKTPDLIHSDGRITSTIIHPEEKTTPSLISPEEKTTPTIISPEERTTPAIIPSEEDTTPFESVTEFLPHSFDLEKETYSTALPKESTELPQTRFEQTTSESTEHLQTRFEQTTPEASSYTQAPYFEENEIVPISIPGEGDCLVDEITYRNNTLVPPASACDTDCICLSSVVSCRKIKCEEPPSPNCKAIENDLIACCPTYSCESNIDEGEQYHETTTKKYEDVSIEGTEELATQPPATMQEDFIEGDKELLPGRKEDHVDMSTVRGVDQEFQSESLMTVSPHKVSDLEEDVTTAAPSAQSEAGSLPGEDLVSTELRVDAEISHEPTTEQPIISEDKHVSEEQTTTASLAPQETDKEVQVDINEIIPTEPKQPSYEDEFEYKSDKNEQEDKTLTTVSPIYVEETFTTTEKSAGVFMPDSDIESHPATEHEGVVAQTISPAEHGTDIESHPVTDHEGVVEQTISPVEHGTDIESHLVTAHEGVVEETISPEEHGIDIESQPVTEHEGVVEQTISPVEHGTDIESHPATEHEGVVAQTISPAEHGTDIESHPVTEHEGVVEQTISPVEHGTDIESHPATEHEGVVEQTISPVEHGTDIESHPAIEHEGVVEQTISPVEHGTDIESHPATEHEGVVAQTISPAEHGTDIESHPVTEHEGVVEQTISPVEHGTDIESHPATEHEGVVEQTISPVEHGTDIESHPAIEHEGVVEQTISPVEHGTYLEGGQPKPIVEESPEEEQPKPITEETSEGEQPAPIDEESSEEAKPTPIAEVSHEEVPLKSIDEESPEEAQLKPVTEESPQEQEHGESMHIATESSTPAGEYETGTPIELHKDGDLTQDVEYTPTPISSIEKEIQTEAIVSADIERGTESVSASVSTEEPATSSPLYTVEGDKEVDIKMTPELGDHDVFIPSDENVDIATKISGTTDVPEIDTTPDQRTYLSEFDGKVTEAPHIYDSTPDTNTDKIPTLWEGLVPSSTKGTPIEDIFGEPETGHEPEASYEPEPSIIETPKPEVDTTEEGFEATLEPDSKLSSKDFSRKEETPVTTESYVEMKPFEVTGYQISEEPEIPFVGDLIKENATNLLEASTEREKLDQDIQPSEEQVGEESVSKVTTEAIVSESTEGISSVSELGPETIDGLKGEGLSSTTSESTTVSEDVSENVEDIKDMWNISSTFGPTTEPAQISEISPETTPGQLKVETSPTEMISETAATTQPSLHLMVSTKKPEQDELTTVGADLITHPPQDKYATESAEISTPSILKEQENLTYQHMETTTLLPSSDISTTSKYNLSVIEDIEQSTKDRTYQTTEESDIFQESSSEPTKGITDLSERFAESESNTSTPATIIEGVMTTTPSLLEILSTEVPQSISPETQTPMVDKITTEHPIALPSSTEIAEHLDDGEKIESQPKATEKPINTTAENDIEKPDSNRIPPQVPKQPTYGQLPPQYPSYSEDDYTEEDEGEVFGPGTCRYGGKLFVSAQQIPRDDPCDFCFCFRSDIICLQQSCPPPISGCHEEPIHGFCCPRYECPVSMGLDTNSTTTTTTSTTLPPHFLHHAYRGLPAKNGCHIQGKSYKIGDKIDSASGPCMHCSCGGDGQMKCEPKTCTPEPMLRQMIAVVASRRR